MGESIKKLYEFIGKFDDDDDDDDGDVDDGRNVARICYEFIGIWENLSKNHMNL